MADEGSTQRSLAVIIADQATPAERTAIGLWAQQLLAIRNSDLTPVAKGRAAIGATLTAKIIWPTLQIAARKVKELGWDNRSRTARLGLGGAAVGLALFGGQGAGIAALGTAIGVPLWVVLGAGAAFANVLLEEVGRRGE